jgi:hypothetical protein
VAGNAARSLGDAVHGDAVVERESVRLVAEGVYVGAGVLAADDDPGGSGARPGFFGSVLVLVVAVQEIGVTGLLVGGMDGHPHRARLLQVEDPHLLAHGNRPPSSSTAE